MGREHGLRPLALAEPTLVSTPRQVDRHGPDYRTPSAAAPDDFKVSLIILETRGRRSWTNELLLSLQIPEFDPLVAEIIVASIDSPEGTYGDEVFVANLTPGSGLGELGALAASEKVLLLSDSVALDKVSSGPCFGSSRGARSTRALCRLP